MNRLIESKFTKIAALPLIVAVGLGSVACNSKDEGPKTSEGALTNVHLIGISKDENMSAVNFGETAGIYDPTTYKEVGQIAAKAGFEIICNDGFKPSAVLVATESGVRGKVNIDNQLIDEINDPKSGIAPCLPEADLTISK